jgi:hypothetical protein
MAAGHPRISFELDLFSTLQQHHNQDGDYAQRKGRTNSVQMWAVGQAMALERSLSLFANPARGTEGVFPEFYFFDCHTCHRRISDNPNFEPGAVNNPMRPIPEGMPAYNDENMIMLAPPPAPYRPISPPASIATAALSTRHFPRIAPRQSQPRQGCVKRRALWPTPSPAPGSGAGRSSRSSTRSPATRSPNGSPTMRAASRR